MDRREALKKLGAGAAIAVAAPAVLPSSRVAHAASGGVGNTGLIGVPESGEPPEWYPVQTTGSDRKREVAFVFDNAAISCVDGGTAEFSVQWRIASIALDSGGPKPVRFAVSGGGGSEYATTPLVNSGFSGGGYGAVSYDLSFSLKKYRSNGKQDLLRNRDDWQLVALCRWHCPGATEDLVAEYAYVGSSNSTPSVSNISWDATAAA